MKHFNVTFRPDGKQISIHSGATLIEAAYQGGFVLNTVCGGGGTCGKCTVILQPEKKEVLACQYKIQQDLTITIPPSSRFFEHKILSEGIDTESEFAPDIYKKYENIAAGNNVLGLAIDIGTTTVVAKLINMLDAKYLATEAKLNPQIHE